MAEGIPPTLHPLVSGKISPNLSDIKENSDEEVPSTTSLTSTLASSARSSLTSSVKNDQSDKKMESSDQDVMKSQENFEKQTEKSVERKQNQTRKPEEMKKIRTRSNSAPQENLVTNEIRDSNSQFKTKKFSSYQGWSISSRKDAKTTPKHSSTPKP